MVALDCVFHKDLVDAKSGSAGRDDTTHSHSGLPGEHPDMCLDAFEQMRSMPNLALVLRRVLATAADVDCYMCTEPSYFP